MSDSCVPSHPDGRAYPWLSSSTRAQRVLVDGEAVEDERFLIYQPFAGMCNQFSSLECAVTLARLTGRTLVLPRWRPQYGWPWLGETHEYFDASSLSQLTKCVTLDEFAQTRRHVSPGEGVALFRLELAYNPTWSAKGFELYPALRSLLEELEYFNEIDKGGALRLGCSHGTPCEHVRDERLTLARPMRGVREVAATFGGVAQKVLALDHTFNIIALPSVLDAGERQLLHDALRPCARLQAKLDHFSTSSVPRPCLAAHVRRTDHWRLAELMGDKRFWPGVHDFAAQIGQQMARRSIGSWLLATDCQEPAELEVLRALPGWVDHARLVEGEDGVAAAVLDMWMCAGADFFLGTRGSMYTDYIERFRACSGRVVDHLFFELGGVGDGGGGGASGSASVSSASGDGCDGDRQPTTLVEVIAARAKAQHARQVAAEDATSMRGNALLGLMSQKLPPELRAKVLTFHPQSAELPSSACKTPKELFDEFIVSKLPALRQRPLAVAPAGSSENVALLIEPRRHACLEHVVRNVMLFLNGRAAEWQLQIFHGTDNMEHIRGAFTPDELVHVQLVSLQVDDLSILAYNELLCSHWLWSRAAGERVLIFQTDSLICRHGIDEFQAWDYIGAPWRLDDLWCVGKPWLTDVGGNGGFSLRSRQKTLACLDSYSYVRGQNEDAFYAEAMSKIGAKLAPRSTGLAFSVESVYAPRSFAFHAAYKWLSAEEMGAILEETSRQYDVELASPVAGE